MAGKGGMLCEDYMGNLKIEKADHSATSNSTNKPHSDHFAQQRHLQPTSPRSPDIPGFLACFPLKKEHSSGSLRSYKVYFLISGPQSGWSEDSGRKNHQFFLHFPRQLGLVLDPDGPQLSALKGITNKNPLGPGRPGPGAQAEASAGR